MCVRRDRKVPEFWVTGWQSEIAIDPDVHAPTEGTIRSLLARDIQRAWKELSVGPTLISEKELRRRADQFRRILWKQQRWIERQYGTPRDAVTIVVTLSGESGETNEEEPVLALISADEVWLWPQ